MLPGPLRKVRPTKDSPKVSLVQSSDRDIRLAICLEASKEPNHSCMCCVFVDHYVASDCSINSMKPALSSSLVAAKSQYMFPQSENLFPRSLLTPSITHHQQGCLFSNTLLLIVPWVI